MEAVELAPRLREDALECLTGITLVRLGAGRVIGLHHNSGERNGKRLDTDCCIVFEVENGRMVSGREHFFDLNNWDEFWS